MDWRGTPGLRRALALPLGSLVAATFGGGLGLAVFDPSRWLQVAVLSLGIFGVYGLVRTQRRVLRQRAAADDWLRSATGGFVPPRYAWRAEQLLAPRQRRMLARTLWLIAEAARERPIGVRLPRAVRVHGKSVQALARALENLEAPVTPAGMLRVIDLITDAGSPLWATASDDALGDALAATFAILTPPRADARAARAA